MRDKSSQFLHAHCDEDRRFDHAATDRLILFGLPDEVSRRTCTALGREWRLSGCGRTARKTSLHGAFFRAAMMSARTLGSGTLMVIVVPGRNLLGDVRNLSRSASVQSPPAFRSAAE